MCCFEHVSGGNYESFLGALAQDVFFNIEIAQASDRLRAESVSLTEVALDVAPPVADAPARVDKTGVELKRGAFLNMIAMLASNFRGIFTFLVARLLGPYSACFFFPLHGPRPTSSARSASLVWTTRSLHSSHAQKLSAIGGASRSLFHVAVVLGVVPSRL